MHESFKNIAFEYFRFDLHSRLKRGVSRQLLRRYPVKETEESNICLLCRININERFVTEVFASFGVQDGYCKSRSIHADPQHQCLS